MTSPPVRIATGCPRESANVPVTTRLPQRGGTPGLPVPNDPRPEWAPGPCAMSVADCRGLAVAVRPDGAGCHGVGPRVPLRSTLGYHRAPRCGALGSVAPPTRTLLPRPNPSRPRGFARRLHSTERVSREAATVRRNCGWIYNNGSNGNHVPSSLRLCAPAGNRPPPRLCAPIRSSFAYFVRTHGHRARSPQR
jgi:hypothetical protein